MIQSQSPVLKLPAEAEAAVARYPADLPSSSWESWELTYSWAFFCTVVNSLQFSCWRCLLLMDRAVANTGRMSAADIINTWDGGHLASRQVGYFRVAAARVAGSSSCNSWSSWSSWEEK